MSITTEFVYLAPLGSNTFVVPSIVNSGASVQIKSPSGATEISSFVPFSIDKFAPASGIVSVPTVNKMFSPTLLVTLTLYFGTGVADGLSDSDGLVDSDGSVDESSKTTSPPKVIPSALVIFLTVIVTMPSVDNFLLIQPVVIAVAGPDTLTETEVATVPVLFEAGTAVKPSMSVIFLLSSPLRVIIAVPDVDELISDTVAFLTLP